MKTDRFDYTEIVSVDYLYGWEGEDSYYGPGGISGEELFVHKATGIVFHRDYGDVFKTFIERLEGYYREDN